MKSQSLEMATFRASLTNITALLPQSHDEQLLPKRKNIGYCCLHLSKETH